MAESKKRKTAPTQELFKQVMQALERIEERVASIETQQTLTNAAWQRQGKVVEEVNKRCMDKLGIKCPLIYDDDTEDGTNEDTKE